MSAPLKLAAISEMAATSRDCEIDYGRACPTIPEGEYKAVFTHHETAFVFKTPKVFLWFRIVELGEHFGRLIYGVYRVKRLKAKPGKNAAFVPAARGKLFWTVYRVLGMRGRPDRFTTQCLSGLVLRIKVRTVRKNYEQSDYPEGLSYSVVDDMTGTETA